jgi:hypothetical protein
LSSFPIESIIKQLASDPALRAILESISLALELIGVAIIVYGAIVTVIFLVKQERVYGKLDTANTKSSDSLLLEY